MVVKTSDGRSPLTSSDTNRLRQDSGRSMKLKNNKPSPKIRGIGSPSKTTSTKRTPSKLDQENILPRTPEKIKPQATPRKLFQLKLSPTLSTNPCERGGPPCLSSIFSTHSSGSNSSPPSSCLCESPRSPNVKVENPHELPESPVSGFDETYGADGVLGDEERSILGGDINCGGSCIQGIATSRQLGGQATHPHQPVSRRNARERNRVKQVSLGFALLRQHVPHSNRKKKLSKVETLRCAVEYIKSLQSLLQENPHPIQPSTLTSSTFQHKTPTIANLQPQTHAPSSLEPFLHIQVNTQVDLPQGETSVPFSLHKMGPHPGSYAEDGHSNAFFENGPSPGPMTNINSCLHPRLLKVPKMEEHFQTPVYTSSIFTLPSAGYAKSSTSTHFTTTSSLLHQSKDIIRTSPAGDLLTEYAPPTFPHSKDINEGELMEALAWWQNNS